MMILAAAMLPREDSDVLEVWLPVFAVALVVAGWYHVLRLRERAIAHVRHLCERHGLQLLDESVALHRLRIVRRHAAVHVLREYRFDVSVDGHDRRMASLTLFGERIVGSSMPERDPPAYVPPAQVSVTFPLPVQGTAVTGRENNVVPIARARRTLH